MSGQLLVGGATAPLTPHLRVRFAFTDGGPELRFVDQRTFGHLLARPRRARDAARGRSRTSPGPAGSAFDLAAVVAGCARGVPVSSARCSTRSLVCGVGNIYADEALWRARLHWARPTERLTPAGGPPGARRRRRR